MPNESSQMNGNEEPRSAKRSCAFRSIFDFQASERRLLLARLRTTSVLAVAVRKTGRNFLGEGIKKRARMVRERSSTRVGGERERGDLEGRAKGKTTFANANDAQSRGVG